MKQEKREVWETMQRDVRETKRALIMIEVELRDAGLVRKANSLSTIIANLEKWQNT